MNITQYYGLCYNTCHAIRVTNDLCRVNLKLEVLEKSVFHLPGALDAILNTRNNRGALWVRTMKGQYSWGCATLHDIFEAYLKILRILKIYKTN